MDEVEVIKSADGAELKIIIAAPRKGMWPIELHKWIGLSSQHKMPILLPGTPL